MPSESGEYKYRNKSPKEDYERFAAESDIRDPMFVPIGALVIIFGAFAVAAVHEYVPNKTLAGFQQSVLLTVVVAIFLCFR